MSAEWTVAALTPAGLQLGALTEVKDLKVTFRLTEPSDVTFTLSGRSSQAEIIEELRTDVLLYRDGTPMLLARVGAMVDTINADSHTLEVNAVDYRGLLHRRTFWSSGATLVFTGDDQSDIAWTAISESQAQIGGDWGITRGVGTATGVTRDRTYEIGKNIGEALDELAAVADGFNFLINTNKEFDLFHPFLGDDVDFAFHFDEGGGNCSQIHRQTDPSEYANAIMQTGGGSTVRVEAEPIDLASRVEGRFEATFGDDDLTVQGQVDDRADSNLLGTSLVDPAYQATLALGTNWDPDQAFLGDTCPIRIRSGRLDVSTTARIFELAIAVDSGTGAEQIDATFNRPNPATRDRRRQRGFANRLDALERR